MHCLGGTIDWSCLNRDYAGIIQAGIYGVQTLILIVGAILAIWQLVVLKRNLQGSNSLDFVRAHREILQLALQYDFLLSLLSLQAVNDQSKQKEQDFTSLCKAQQLTDAQTRQARMFYSMLINRMATAYVQVQLRNVPGKMWAGYEPDIRDCFSRPLSQARWYEVRKFHDPDFREWVDAILEGNHGLVALR